MRNHARVGVVGEEGVGHPERREESCRHQFGQRRATEPEGAGARWRVGAKRASLRTRRARSRGGIPAYTEFVAQRFPDTRWAHYATAYDGGLGGQTGFAATPFASFNFADSRIDPLRIDALSMCSGESYAA